jgi:hypothetical protein
MSTVRKATKEEMVEFNHLYGPDNIPTPANVLMLVGAGWYGNFDLEDVFEWLTGIDEQCTVIYAGERGERVWTKTVRGV